MATTKTSEKKTATKKGAPAVEEQGPGLADEILVTLLHRALVRLGEPARISEIARELGEDDVSASLVRFTLASHPRRFVAVDRRWDIAQRYLDKERPVERVLEELISTYGAPMPADEAPGELAQIYGRVREYFDDVAPRMLNGARFFPVRESMAYGLRSWLLDTSAANEDDLLFYNYLSPEALQPFRSIGEGLDWESDPVGAARAIVEAGGGMPVDNRIVQYFAYAKLGDEFDSAAFYDAVSCDNQFLALQDHRWLLSDALDAVRAEWRIASEQVPDISAEEIAAEAVVEAPAAPLEISDDDAKELQDYFEDREEIATVGELLTNVLEIRSSSPTFAEDAETVIAFLRARPDVFLWVGGDRFRAPGTLPPYIGQLPESLRFPTLPRFETADGEILDQMLSDDAFEDDLAEEIMDPIAQDVNDQEPSAKTAWPEGVSPESQSLRLVLKSHHKEIGTFPLAQVPLGFFPTEPNIVELALLDPAGNSYPLYVDYDVQLIYGLFDVYAEIAADSGAVFHIEKTENAGEYRFVFDNETDPGVFVSPARMEELAEYRSEIEAGSPVSTYDIIRTILDHYRKGTSFLTLLTEVNLVRRTPRRLLASILSGYAAFHLRANRWTFDAKKEPEGFDKRKVEYIVKA